MSFHKLIIVSSPTDGHSRTSRVYVSDKTFKKNKFFYIKIKGCDASRVYLAETYHTIEVGQLGMNNVQQYDCQCELGEEVDCERFELGDVHDIESCIFWLRCIVYDHKPMRTRDKVILEKKLTKQLNYAVVEKQQLFKLSCVDKVFVVTAVSITKKITNKVYPHNGYVKGGRICDDTLVSLIIDY